MTTKPAKGPLETAWEAERKKWPQLLAWSKVGTEVRERFERDLGGCRCEMCRGPRQGELEMVDQHKGPADEP